MNPSGFENSVSNHFQINLHGIRLAYTVHGLAGDRVIFYFHGFPGCHVEGEWLDFQRIALQLNCRIICIDRPGMGNSEFVPGRKMADWPATVSALADHLGVEMFSVMGLSGGGPYVLATAWGIPERLQAAVVVSGMVPFHFPESKHDIAVTLPAKSPSIRKILARAFRTGVNLAPVWLAEKVVKILPQADQKLFSDRENLRHLLNTYRTALKQGTIGYLHEAEIYRRFWGFNPADITFPVIWWHGTADKNVTIGSARRLADELPVCSPHFIEGEGHFSLIASSVEAIIGNALHLRR